MPKRILVIDDEEMITLLYQKELGREGYEVDAAGNGGEALKMISEKEFDVIVLDIEMPDIFGLDILQEIRKCAPGSAIILNSAYATYKADFQSWLADDYLVKSSDLRQLKDRIKHLTGVK